MPGLSKSCRQRSSFEKIGRPVAVVGAFRAGSSKPFSGGVFAHQMLVNTYPSSGLLPTAEPIDQAAKVKNSKTAIRTRNEI